jgi:hypothetical protein
MNYKGMSVEELANRVIRVPTVTEIVEELKAWKKANTPAPDCTHAVDGLEVVLVAGDELEVQCSRCMWVLPVIKEWQPPDEEEEE